MKVCWNLTNICNEDCVFCFRDLVEPAISLEDNMNILNKLSSLGVCSITYAGGEPLLYKGIKDLLSYSRYLGIKNNLITNGSLLNKDNLSEYLCNVDKLTFSIDSPSEYINESNGRGKNHYKHIKELLPYIKREFPNLILEINTVATNTDLQEVDFMFEAIGSELSFYGIKKWKISRFCPLRGHAKERKDFFNIPDDVFASIKEKYDGRRAMFEVSVRDFDSIEENLVISPQGNFKKAINGEEEVLVEGIATTGVATLKKSLGGHYVQ